MRALRPNKSERDLKRRSTLNPTGFGLFRRADKSVEHLNANLVPPRFAVSEDGTRPRSRDVQQAVEAEQPRLQEPTTPSSNSRRFSLMRFRHASDSQLSLKAREQHHARVAEEDEESVPPVPQIPNISHAPPPAIITTAPTLAEPDELEPAKRKRASRMNHFSLRRRSFDPHSTDRPSLRQSLDRPPKQSSDSKRHAFSFHHKKSRDVLREEEPARSSAQQPRPEPLVPPARSASDSAQEATEQLSVPVPRASESSRSDGSSGAGHVSFEQTQRPRHPPKTGSTRFTFGRRHKQRASLFPLPSNLDPSNFSSDTPTRISNSVDATRSVGDSPLHPQAQENGLQSSPIPNSSQVALAAASMNLASPATGLLRNDSVRSVRSSQSSPNSSSPIRLALRGRSSTMGSLGGRSEAPSPTPPLPLSGRTSTSTAGRPSFSLFGLASRLRQNSGLDMSRHGLNTPGYMSGQHPSMNISREALVAPEREEGETAGRYLERLEASNSDKSAIASFLSKTAEPFLLTVLRSYMRKFAFFGDPMDMAVRKLLMQVDLPKETQQIDRVLQGFADRYHECNPGIYLNEDQAYFIAFSIVILHTDFFNRNNKRKMQRSDYIRNSSTEGVSEDVLGCFYDNIVYTPFIKMEDEVDLKAVASRRSKRSAAAVLKGPLADPAKRATREPIDPYALILDGKLDVLRPNIKDVMNVEDPYSYRLPSRLLDVRALYRSFSRYGVIQIRSPRSRPEAFMSQSSQENPLESSAGIVEMPVTKIGILWRKDTKRKKARSPWQEWGVVLTRSGLSIFKSSSWAKHLMHQHEQHQKQGDGGIVVFQPPLEEFKPEHLIPLDGAVALVDNTYKKHKNSFVISSKVGEETFLADSEKELNDWLGLINYSAAFETCGVRPRGMIGGLYEGQRNRGIRRLDSSNSASTKSIATATGEVTIQSGKIDKQFAQQMMESRRILMQRRIAELEETIGNEIKDLDSLLRDARHLQILAPVQPKTRELVIHAAGRLSARLKWKRINIWRMKCHRDILAQDVEDEKQSALGRPAPAEIAQPPSSQPTPQPLQKQSKVSGLARLASKTSSLTGSHKPPLSPTTSLVRPGTKSSQNTELGGEESFKTPPETRQTSPTSPAATGFTNGATQPLGLHPSHQSSHRRPSLASTEAHSPRLAPKDHRPSVSTVGDHTFSSDATSEKSHYTAAYTEPERERAADQPPKTPELLPLTDGARLDVAESESEAELKAAGMTGSPGSRTKVRRGLQRTLRDGHAHGGSAHSHSHSHARSLSHSHRRGHKGRDSASTIVSDDTQESEGLARGQGSFTVHGKKASVITFGLDWHNMPAEERLKTRKQAAAHEALELGSPLEVPEKVGVGIRGGDGDGDGHSVRSIKSSSTATVDLTPPDQRRSERDRHVSGATITPANFQGGDEADAREGAVNGAAGGKEKKDDSRDEDSDAVSEMSDIKEEESPLKETEMEIKREGVDVLAPAQKEKEEEKERPAVEGDAVPIRPVDS